MKTSIIKKFYAFILILIGMFSANTNAQIVYTDVNPDIVSRCNSGSCSGDYSLDLNNDGINDFILSPRKKAFICSCFGLNGRWINYNGSRDSAVISSTSQSWIADRVGGYDLNTLIDSSLHWTNFIHILATKHDVCVPCPTFGYWTSHQPGTGPWNNINGKYLALKTQVGTDFYYGWVKLGVATAIGIDLVSITIMEYAFNSIPNQPILAGQTNTTGIIENSFASSINLFPNPANNHLTIVLPITNKKVEVSITDITGKIIYTTTAIETKNIVVSTKDFAEGIYNVQIQTEDFIATKKLVVEK